MCNINITSQKFRFPIFPFCFLLFIFSFFFLFFLFFPFSFPVFLLSFLSSRAGNARANQEHRVVHARVPVSVEFQVWAPPQTRSQRRLPRISRASKSPPNHSRPCLHAISIPKPNPEAVRIQMSSRSLHAELKPSRNKRAQSHGDTWHQRQI